MCLCLLLLAVIRVLGFAGGTCWVLVLAHFRLAKAVEGTGGGAYMQGTTWPVNLFKTNRVLRVYVTGCDFGLPVVPVGFHQRDRRLGLCL